MLRLFSLSVLLFVFYSVQSFGQVIYPDDTISIDTVAVDTISVDAIVVDTVAVAKTIEEEDEHQNTDIIYFHSGKKKYVNVKKIYFNNLYYSMPGNRKVEKMDQRYVYKIKYKTGKVEILNEDKPQIRKVSDWRKVKITKEENNVAGLVEVARLEAKAEGSERGYSTPESLERSATIILKRKAALINAHIVLIIDKKSYFAFGEIPSMTLIGIAYKYE